MYQSSSGLWPHEAPRLTKSEAEKKVYDALKLNLPKGWCTWHSLKLRSEARGKFSEADFIIADPNRPSILVLEVKGGRIEQHDGRWYQNSFLMSPTPLDQAFAFRKLLIARFNEKRIDFPIIGVAVCFPDTFFSQQPSQDDLHGLVIGKQDLTYLDQILPDVMVHAAPDPRQITGPWLDLIHSCWGETWVPKLRLGDKIKSDTDHRVQLDEKQLECLDKIERNNHILITGAAGTGKTLLAREAAIRETEDGKRVLLLCFTDALACWLRGTITHNNITSMAVRQFAAQLLHEDTSKISGADSSEYWNNVSLRAAIDGLPEVKNRWDSVIIDEGQDFSKEDWDLVSECSKKTDRLWVFADEGQAFWEDRKIPSHIEKNYFQYQLGEPYRCPPEIQHMADCYAGHCQIDLQLLRRGIQTETIRLTTCSEQRVIKQIGKEINRLLVDGIQPNEIAIISVRGRGEKENICHQRELGGHKVFLATDNEADSQIICDTFLRFKGLERPVLIITDLNSSLIHYETRMYIAISRATSLLRIVGIESEIKKDPRLAFLF